MGASLVRHLLFPLFILFLSHLCSRISLEVLSSESLLSALAHKEPLDQYLASRCEPVPFLCLSAALPPALALPPPLVALAEAPWSSCCRQGRQVRGQKVRKSNASCGRKLISLYWHSLGTLDLRRESPDVKTPRRTVNQITLVRVGPTQGRRALGAKGHGGKQQCEIV